jgi:two-component system sensor histidine kinase KdpD
VAVREASTRIAGAARIGLLQPERGFVELAAAGAAAPEVEVVHLPLGPRENPFGKLSITGPWPGTADIADAFARQLTLAFERLREVRGAQEARLQAEAQAMRSALLSAASHDLRTPLAAILGSASALEDGGDTLPPTARAELFGSIRDEAERMEHLVEKLPEMTRLTAGLDAAAARAPPLVA